VTSTYRELEGELLGEHDFPGLDRLDRLKVWVSNIDRLQTADIIPPHRYIVIPSSHL
jgi:hypothetical protein